MSKISKNYLYNLIYQVVVLILPLLITPYVARVLGAHQLGIYDYVNSIVTLIYTLGLLGIGHYGNRECAYTRDDKEELSETFWSILAIQIILGFFSLLFLYIFSNINSNYQVYFRLFSIWLFGSILDCTWFYRGLEEMQYVVLKNIIAKLLFTIATFLFVKSETDLTLYVLIYGLSVLVANVSAYSQLRMFISRPKINIHRFTEIILGSLKLFLPSIIMQIMLSADKIVLGSLSSGISNVSYYSNAEKIIQIPLSLIVVLNSVMMPRIANEFRNRRLENMKKYLTTAAEFSLFLAVPLSIGLYAIADTFVPWFLGESFMPSMDALKWLAPIAIGNALLGVSGSQYFVAVNKTKVLFFSNTLAAILNILLDLLLAPRFGVVGVCLATIVSLTSSVIVQYYIMSKDIPIIPILKSLFKYLIYSMIMGIIIIVSFKGYPANYGTTIKQIVLGIVVYFGLSLLTRDVFVFQALDFVKKGFKKSR